MENTSDNAFVSTTDSIPGYKVIKQLNVIATYDQDLSFTLIDKRMQKLMASMLEKSKALGGNAVVGIKMMSHVSALGIGGSVIVYGTAVLVQPA